MSTEERSRLIDTPSSSIRDGEIKGNKVSNGGANGATTKPLNDEEASASQLLPSTATTTTSTTPPPSSSLFSLLWNCGTACVLTSAATRSGSAAALKGIDHRVRALWVVLVRSVAALGLTALTRARSPQLRDAEPFFGKPGARPLMVARGAVAAGSILFFYSAVEKLPLADALALNFLSPVIAASLSWAVHGEDPGISGLLAALATVVGVALVAQPEALFGGNGGSGGGGGSSVGGAGGAGRAVGVLLAIVSAFCAASGFTILRALSSRPEGPPAALTTAAYFHVCSFLGSSLPLTFEAVAAVVRREPFPGVGAPGAGPPKLPTDLFLAVVLVGGGFIGQTLMNRAFLLEPAAKMAALNTTQVLDGHVYALLFLGEKESLLGVLGSALIVGGAVTAALGKGGGGGGGGGGRGKATAEQQREEDERGLTTTTATAEKVAVVAATPAPRAAAPNDVELAAVVTTTTLPSPSRSAAGVKLSGRYSSGLANL